MGIKKILLLLIGMTFMLPAFATDFMYEYEGQTLMYTVIDESSKTCKTKAFLESSALYGDLVVPEKAGDYTVTAIGNESFAFALELTSVKLPATIKEIGDRAFVQCAKLSSIEIPSSVEQIGKSVFSECGALTSITIPSSVIEIGELAFYHAGLKSMILPESLNTISRGLFIGCTELTSVEIPNSITYIGDEAFAYCYALSSIIIPDSVTGIGRYAFSCCVALNSIDLPASVTEIGERAFEYCETLTGISVDSNNKSFCSYDGVLFNKDKNVLVAYPGGKTGEYEIPGYINKIGNYAFAGCSGLTSVIIPESVNEIPNGAFRGCSGLTNVNIPYSINSIGSHAFAYCYNATTLNLPSSITEIGERAFVGWESLGSVYYDTVEPIEGNENIFQDLTDEAVLYVPESAVEKCRKINPWMQFKNIMIHNFSSGLVEINGDADNGLPAEIYNLSGMRIGSLTGELPSGIYLLRQGKELQKIIVK